MSRAVLHLIDTGGPGGAETIYFQVALGLGPERFGIAWLSRTRRLTPLSLWFASILKPFSRR